MDKIILGTEISGFGGRFGLQKQRTSSPDSSRNLNRVGHRFLFFVIVLRAEMKSVRRQCMALLSGMLNVFAHCEFSKLLSITVVFEGQESSRSRAFMGVISISILVCVVQGEAFGRWF